MLHALHLIGGDDVAAAGCGDVDVGDVEDVLQPGHLEAVHRCLQRADRVNLGDDHSGTLAAK
jgi:hypothetical protein